MKLLPPIVSCRVNALHDREQPRLSGLYFSCLPAVSHEESKMPSAPSPSPVLSISRLTVRRGKVAVLRRLDWTVRPGEMWTILGPNGSGKTSLLNCLTGLLMPSEGRMELLGGVYGETDWIELRRRVGIVSNSLSRMVDDEETGLRVIASGASGQINHWGRIPAPVAARACRLALEARCLQVLDRSWAVLSQGERQRVLIARALMQSPGLVILDEPCAGLDPSARERLVQLMQRMATRKHGPALVLVTHHLEEIPPACTHALVLREGRVLASGPAPEVITSSVLTKAFRMKLEVTNTSGRWRAG